MNTPTAPNSTPSHSGITTIAQSLKILAMQGVALVPQSYSSPGKTPKGSSSQEYAQGYIVPTLDGTVLQISPTGKIRTIANLLRSDLGVPFGVAVQKDAIVVTSSDYTPRHFLVRIAWNGAVKAIVDLSQVSGEYGAPFGVAVDVDGSYLVTLSTDVTESTSVLLRVTPQGTITRIVELSQFGNPFGTIVHQGNYIVAQAKGDLLRITPKGKISSIINLVAANLGIPFQIAAQGDDLIATTNQGLVVRVKPNGTATPIVNLQAKKYGVPSGIAITDRKLIITTNSGYLLQIDPDRV